MNKQIPIDEYTSIHIGTIVHDPKGKDYSRCIDIRPTDGPDIPHYYFNMFKKEYGELYDWNMTHNSMIGFSLKVIIDE